MEYEIEPITEITVVTENSVWLVRPFTYHRTPRTEAPRPETLSIDGKLKDATWHQHDGVWLHVENDGGWRVRILPAGRPEGSVGVLSGLIEAISEKV